MKKKVLFVMGSARAGGTVTSLLNLLSLLDENKVEAHLFLQNHTGILLPRAAEYKLLPEDIVISSVLCPRQELRSKGLFALLFRLAFKILCLAFGAKKTYAYFYKKSAKKLSGKYDAVVAYQEGDIADYVGYIDAPCKVAWCHTSYDKFCIAGGHTQEEWKKIYSDFDFVACVSNIVLKSMVDKLDYPKEKIGVIRNTIPPEYIRSRASESVPNIKKSKIILVSSGRYVRIKRFDRFVIAAEALKQKAIDFTWYLLGNGEEYNQISEMIKQKGLDDCIIQVGAVENPFVYYNIADVFVMASETEGQPMVLNEALTLGVPVITTEFASAYEVVENGKFGMIVPNTDDGLVNGVLLFAENEGLQASLTRGAMEFCYNNDEILQRIYEILQVTEEKKQNET